MITEALLLVLLSLGITAMVNVSGAGQVEHNLPDYLEMIKKAETLDDSAVGYAAKKTKTFEAFEKALGEGSSIKAEIEWLLNNSTPAGRLYAAILLNEIDSEAGHNAFKKLLTDKAMVKYCTGSLFSDMAVSELAKELLENKPVLIYRKPVK